MKEDLLDELSIRHSFFHMRLMEVLKQSVIRHFRFVESFQEFLILHILLTECGEA